MIFLRLRSGMLVSLYEGEILQEILTDHPPTWDIIRSQ